MLTMKPAPPVPSRVTYLRLYLLDSIVKPSNFQEAKNHSSSSGDIYIPKSRWVWKRVTLGGGFEYFLCSPLFGEMIHFD